LECRRLHLQMKMLLHLLLLLLLLQAGQPCSIKEST
jgi:hypothetical protein